MLNYVFLTEDKKYLTVEIELLKTVFVDRWVSILKNVLLNIPQVNWFLCGISNNVKYRTERDIQQYLTELQNSFMFLHNKKFMNFEHDLKEIKQIIENPQNINQSMLNRWHRYFTTLENKYSFNHALLLSVDEMNELYKNIHIINEMVHKCEGYTYPGLPRRLKFKNPLQYAVQFTNANNHSYFVDKQINHNAWQYCENLELNSYNSFTDPNDNNYTVWLNEDIVGKDQVKAWLDHDDLTQDDITGSLVITPNLIFDPNKLYQRVLSDPEFQYESRQSGKNLDRPPIGNITNINSIDWDKILGGKLIQIEHDNNILWRTIT